MDDVHATGSHSRLMESLLRGFAVEVFGVDEQRIYAVVAWKS